MILKKAEILSSPYLGIYSFCTDDYCLAPSNILDKESKFLEKNLNVKVIKTSINQSPLIGVYLPARPTLSCNRHEVLVRGCSTQELVAT